MCRTLASPSLDNQPSAHPEASRPPIDWTQEEPRNPNPSQQAHLTNGTKIPDEDVCGPQGHATWILFPTWFLSKAIRQGRGTSLTRDDIRASGSSDSQNTDTAYETTCPFGDVVDTCGGGAAGAARQSFIHRSRFCIPVLQLASLSIRLRKYYAGQAQTAGDMQKEKKNTRSLFLVLAHYDTAYEYYFGIASIHSKMLTCKGIALAHTAP